MSALAIVDPIVIRCSSSDRVVACAGSLLEVAEPFTPLNPEANEGSAAHQGLRSVPLGREPDLDAIADKFGVSLDVLMMLIGKGRQAWADVERWFTGERFDELPLEARLSDDVILRGTSDLVAVDIHGGKLLRLGVLDWKGGPQPTEHPNQVKSYAYCAREEHGMPESGYILGAEIWLRLGTFRLHKFTAAQLDAYRDQLLEQVRRKGKQFGPGDDACKYCPRQNECAALDAYRRSAIAPLVQVAGNQAITPALVGEYYEQAKMLATAAERVKQIAKQMVEAGAQIRLPDGRLLVIEDQEQDEIIPSLAQDFMRELAPTADELDEMVSVTKGGLERVMKGRVPKGGGAAAMRTAMSKLKALNAVRKVSRRMLKASSG